jgi:hypothetical protein
MQTIAPARSGHPRALLAVLLVAPFLASVDATIANVATPAIRTSLGASGAEAELVVGGYLVAYAMLLITGARMRPDAARSPSGRGDHAPPSRHAPARCAPGTT